ncbi:MAG: orotidine-5'-phosphate decarboxylase [Candidatus Odyssella sp.]|nr:orotidine-5'-phosphate decarboxylase [Candidatus Odyssella sp.]
MTEFLSKKPIPPRERLIVALDMPSAAEAKALVERLGDAVWFYKLGLELFMGGGYFELMEWLAARGKKVFVDLKFFDIPQTVGSAVRNLAKRNAYFATVHAYEPVVEAALANKGGTRILAVTVLTSFDDKDLANAGYRHDVRTTVLARARSALARGCDGIVCSGQEAEAIRRELGPDLLLVTPGIRPFENRPSDGGRTKSVRLTPGQAPDDQKRAVDVEDAFRYGADYIVVGRPIRAAADPALAAAEIQRRIAALFAGVAAR